MGWTKSTLGGLLAALLVLLAASPALSQGLRDRLNTAREQLAELAADEYSHVGIREIERARIDIDEAADYLANRREELAQVSVIRLENRVKLIRALLEQAEVEALASERETAAIEMTREADQAQVASESAELRRARLREEVNEILQQLEVGQ
jgi:hypothetical protein